LEAALETITQASNFNNLRTFSDEFLDFIN
jgi:hypothetical protein